MIDFIRPIDINVSLRGQHENVWLTAVETRSDATILYFATPCATDALEERWAQVVVERADVEGGDPISYDDLRRERLARRGE